MEFRTSETVAGMRRVQCQYKEKYLINFLFLRKCLQRLWIFLDNKHVFLKCRRYHLSRMYFYDTYKGSPWRASIDFNEVNWFALTSELRFRK